MKKEIKQISLIMATVMLVGMYIWFFIIPIPFQLGALFDEAYLRETVAYSSQERKEQVAQENENALERARDIHVVMNLPSCWQVITLVITSLIIFFYLGIFGKDIKKAFLDLFTEKLED